MTADPRICRLPFPFFEHRTMAEILATEIRSRWSGEERDDIQRYIDNGRWEYDPDDGGVA